MKKPKKIRKYEADGYIFDTFKELKNYVYFLVLRFGCLLNVDYLDFSI